MTFFRTTVVLGAATALTGGTLTAAAAECRCWRYVRPQGRPSDTVLTDVTQPAPGAGWAVGRRGNAPFAVVWDGTQWRETLVPAAPETIMEGVSAASRRDAWAVAAHKGDIGSVFRWDRRQWRQSPFPGTPRDVSARANDDVWIAGSAKGKAAAWHWNGKAWRRAPIAPVTGELTAVSARGRADAWAVGSRDDRPLIMHWNGRSWTSPPGAARGGRAWLTDVVALSPAEAWAVGATATAPLAERWDGRSWAPVPVPGLKGRFDTVAGDGRGGVWAGGEDDGGRPIAAHWADGRWDVSRPPVPDPSGDDADSGPAAVLGLARVPGTTRMTAAGSYGRHADPLRHAITWTTAPRPR
ncbi:hypothetical protein [Actinomadura macrotermitis]|uniref:Uncharacterized protein n=1 Tax=Actinomadura macrotermitis TaxID=2585200 RepID=A0A7K0C217_9ACTN|nr:hypothetical protein [Actinomadura macrotermitis]MQY07132.1 hypothetical protein [Actinomadura macrotermitis]